MASSQFRSESVQSPGAAGAFPFAWNSPAIPGSETVITTLRSDAYLATPDSADQEPAPEHLRRLFPANLDLDESAGIRLGHFTIQRRIGIGGMGSVFLATDEQLRRSVALKVLSPTLTSDHSAVLRFQNEARAAARLDHDNIARIFYYGEDAGLHYIAYEYIPGSNLRDVIRSKERLAPAEAVNYAMQLAAALSHTSAAGVIHRDIKPSNVLITPQGRAKLVDLGLARKESADTTSAELTVAGTTLGTFDYISPEQAKDPRSVDVRSDIYSLGCTLYHMLTGEPPYPEGTVLQKLLDHQGKEPPDPMRKNRRVPPALSAIVRKMMASEPRKRYSTPAKLLSDLLKIARMLGTGAVPIDGQVWLTATRADRPVWQGNIGWIATAAALLFVVIVMERFPQLTRQLDPRASSGAAISSSSRSNKSSTDSNTAQIPPSPGATAPRMSSDTSDMPWRLPADVVTPEHPAAAGVTPKPVPNPETGAGKKIFDDLEILSQIPGDTDFVSVPAPEKNKPPQVPEMPSGQVPGRDAPATTRPVTPRPADTAATPVATLAGSSESQPVISIVGGKSYGSLEAACSEARDGTIIELRYNGRRGQTEPPIRLTNKENVIIRSGIGYRPMIEFAPTDPPTAAESRMMTVIGGSLQLINVDVVLTVPERITADRWAVFSLERPRELQLQDVTVTLVNPANQPACLIEQKAAPGQSVGNMGIMKNGSPVAPPQVGLFDCLVRGQCDVIFLRDAVSARYQMKNSVVAVQGALLHAVCQSEMNNSENDRFWLDLESLTCLAADGLVLTEGVNQLNDHTPPLTVSARDNVFWCAPNRSLVAMLDAADLMEMQRRFEWAGDRNHYDSLTMFWQLGGRLGLAPSRQLDFEAWRSYWGSAEGAGSVNSPVKWRDRSIERSGPSAAAWPRIDYSTVELDAHAMANSANRVPGAVLTKLPPVPNDEATTNDEFDDEKEFE
jgi:serine/threonine-protein kinase